MCGDPHGWLCDECFGNLDKIKTEDFEFCDECENKVQRMCFCCDTLQDEPVDVICDSCQQDFDGKEVTYIEKGYDENQMVG